STSHVRIVAGAGPHDPEIGGPQKEERPIRPGAQSPPPPKIAAVLRPSREAQKFLPLRRPRRPQNINHKIKNRVIAHLASSQRYISQPCLSASCPVRMASNFSRTLSRIESDPTGAKSTS